MSADFEMEKWRRQWQADPASAPRTDELERLKQRVLRETRWAKISLIAPVLVTVLVGGSIALQALRTRETVYVVTAIEGWVFIAAIWVGSLAIARGTWRPLADTTAAFVDLSIRRRRANLRGATFAAYAYVLQLLFVVLVMTLATPSGGVAVLTAPYVKLFGWVGLPVVLAGVYWFRRRQRAELERLRELKRQLQSD